MRSMDSSQDVLGPAPAPAFQGVVLPAREGTASYLVVLLHGVGADAASFAEIGRALQAELPRADFVVPDGFHPFDGAATGRQWFSVRGVTEENRGARVRHAGAEVSKWIDGELARRSLGGERLVVVGFSQGAIVAAWLAVHRAPNPAAVVVLSGRVADDEVAVKGTTHTPVLLAHGEQDPVISASHLEPAARVLEAWGARVTKRTYPGLGHSVDTRELRDVTEFVKGALAQAAPAAK